VSTPADISADIKQKALSLGFDAAAITTKTDGGAARAHLRAFLEQNRQGDMAWMEQREGERASPAGLWPDVRSIIMVAMNYGPDHDPLAALEEKSRGVLSVYAQNKDYHDIVKKRLKALARFMIENFGGDVKVFVDTAPVMEKPLAAAAGLGWQGKHTNLVSREFGSWLFIGSVFTTLDLQADEKETDHCGTCRRCLDVCPTDAFPTSYQLDARRCISYLTIEHKGPIPHEFRRAMGNRIYGCDDCLAVCPWNKFAETASQTAFHARTELKSPSLATLSALDDTGFRALFKASPVKRLGRDRFIRNVMIAIGNSGDASLAPWAIDRLEDAAPLVRGAAVWAALQLLPSDEFTARRETALQTETDPGVVEEWRGDGKIAIAALNPP